MPWRTEISRKFLPCLAALLCWIPALSEAAGDQQKELDRLAEKVRIDPMTFIVAKGDPNGCGQGCTEWIAAQGQFDQGAAERFREFLTALQTRDLPIYFHSDGGLLREAVQIGLILRRNQMTAGVGRTVPEGCHLGMPLDGACRRLMQSQREHKAKLYFGGARCGSACVYAIIGASTRHVDPGATLRIHSGVGPELDKAESFLRRYVLTMGVDPALVDAATKIPSRTFRGLSRGEMERFGVESHGIHETPWVALHTPAGDFVVLKSVTYQSEDKRDEYRTTTVGLKCSVAYPRIRFIYHQELTIEQSRTLPKIRARIGANVIDLPASSSRNELVDRYFDLAPEQLQSALDTRTFEIIETFDPPILKKPPRIVRFSTLGLSPNMVALDSECTPKRNATH